MPRKHVFGLTPWGKYFIEAMEGLADTGRLDRGRSYAGNGHVLKLDLDGTLATAKVEGNYRPYYRVKIEFEPLSREQRAALLASIDEDPMFKARIAAGELPPELIDRLERRKIHLLPTNWSQMRRSCDCPDYGDPCKHMAAVYYIIAQEIDRDPAALFRLRGVDLRIHAAEGGESNGAAPRIVPPPIAFEWTTAKSWTGSISEVPVAPPIAHYASVIPSFLPALPPLAGVDFRPMLTEFYHYSARYWGEVFVIKAMDEASSRAFARADHLFVIGEKSCVLKSELYGELPLFDAAARSIAVDETGGSASFLFLRSFAQILRSIVDSCAFYPDVEADADSFACVWKPALFGADVRAALDSLAPIATPPELAIASPKKSSVPTRSSYLVYLATSFLSEYVAKLRFPPSKASFASSPVFAALFRRKRVDASSPANRSLPKAVDGRFAVYDLAVSARRFELVVAAARKRKREASPTESQSDAPAYSLKANVVGTDGARSPLHKVAAAEGTELLAFPALLSSIVPSLSSLASTARALLSEEELANLVVDVAPLLSRLGVGVTLPKELAKLAAARPVMTAKRRAGGGNLVSYLDATSAFTFEWKIALGGELISAEEFEALVRKGEKLIRFRNSYVRLDAREAAAVLERLRSERPPDVFDALQSALTGDVIFPAELEASLSRLVASPGIAAGPRQDVPSSLNASLRPYQARGYGWIMANLAEGFGCILADDMGLGKTVQAIAALLSLKESGQLADGAIVCSPATLVTNWERELAKFAPSLSVVAYYGAGRRRKDADVLLTSYETFLRDAKKFEGNQWDLVILDEAHLIKNPDAKKTRAVKGLTAKRRLALSGTPVENNLAELWSLFDFAVPGYLGTLSDFAAKYRKPIEIERSLETADRLRRVTAPFLLRRLKTDKSIIADLPEKVIVEEYASLTAEQAALYRAVAEDGLAKVEESEGMARRGLVLALITALKQISNHPRNWDKESAPDAERSGKARLLLAILDSALESGEKVLVFSQYVEMLDILYTLLERDLGIRALRLHGGMTKAARDAAVDRFQTERGGGVFLISLKAGGVGLNLTSASRVIHYDLWFNPAVENQATDRAFRIGQTKNVFVHRLVTRDTLEERIDATLKAKRELADLAIGAGETWLTELKTEELRDLVSLR